MQFDSRYPAALVIFLAMLIGSAWAQDKLVCDTNGNIRTPELVEGKVSKINRSQGKLTVQDGDGKDYEFRASNETLQDIKIGDVIKAKLREAPKCSEK
jgi:hypothetical protein